LEAPDPGPNRVNQFDVNKLKVLGELFIRLTAASLDESGVRKICEGNGIALLHVFNSGPESSLEKLEKKLNRGIDQRKKIGFRP